MSQENTSESLDTPAQDAVVADAVAPASVTAAEEPATPGTTEEATEAAATEQVEAPAAAEQAEAPAPAEQAETTPTAEPAAEVPTETAAEESPSTAPETTETAAPAAPAPHPSPIPRPTPRPGGPRPSPAAATPAAVVVEPLLESSDPSQWGRVDEAGVVYLRTATGEREVGSWQAGEPEAGLTHYGRRYDDFVTEIALLEKRLATKSGDPKATKAQAQQLRDSIDTLAAVGDLDSAAARLETVIGAADEVAATLAQERAAARAAAVATKEALCAEAETLAESTQWKATGDRLKAIVDEWRSIRGIDRKVDDALWKRFARARDTFTRRRGSHFADMDKERSLAKDAKEKLITRAEELSESTEWGETAGEYRNLMAEWKASGRAPRDVEDALWDRFRAAQEKFFSRRNQTFADRDAEFDANAKVKEELLVEAEKIDPTSDLDGAKGLLRSIQDRWEAAGKVPRERIRELDARLRAVEDKVKSAEDSLWRKTDPETTARLEQFRSRAETFRAQAAKATAAGDKKRAAQAEAQAEQWEEWLKAAENAVED
ncbi:DUF349 domain-containing protein [Nakamurella silvestris]|nr:DUF349 domain-containing protein [Nakamurella silvestris]